MGDVRSTACRTRPWAALHPRVQLGWVVPLAGCLSIIAFLVLGLGTAPAGAVPKVDVTPSPLLTLTGTPVELQLSGDLESAWPATRAAVEIRGPLIPSQGTEAAPVAFRFEEDLGDLPGALDDTWTVPPEAMTAPGAYYVTVSLASGSDLRASGSSWLGRVTAAQPTVDLAVVWPALVGVHRDTGGVFVDSVVQDVVTPAPDSPGSIYSLLGIAESFPAWHVTVAFEPLLLGQIRDLSDGYQTRDADGVVVDVSEEDQIPTFARQALSTLAAVAGLESHLFIPTPYASPDMALLAQEGWADGFTQMQLGKSELASGLQLDKPSDGAYPPGQNVTTDSLASFSDAAIDYVLVGQDVAQDLVTQIGPAGGVVRVMDRDNNRLTFMVADAELQAALAPPRSLDRFAAALAAELAAGRTGPLIATPPQDYGWPTGSYLEAMGDMLARAPYLRTLTLEEVRSSHPPDTRPVFLTRYGGRVEGFVGREFLKELRLAHRLVTDLDESTTSDRAPLDPLYVQLFEAESRYWFLGGVSPEVANLALSYPQHISQSVREELDKVDVAADTSVIIVGNEGDVPVAVVNQTGYPMTVQLELTGDGVEFPDGDVQAVELGPQENVFSIPVRTSRGSTAVGVRVRAGETTIDEEVVVLRSISVRSVVPWLIGAAAVIALTFVVVRRLR